MLNNDKYSTVTIEKDLSRNVKLFRKEKLSYFLDNPLPCIPLKNHLRKDLLRFLSPRHD